MKRSRLLAYLRIAGYHNDNRTYTRILIENRISMKAARDAFIAGSEMKERGVPCSCSECSK